MIQQRTVCFMDLLGFSAKVNSIAQDSEALQKVTDVILEAKSLIEHQFRATDLTFQNLSDSIFISTSENTQEDLENIVKCTQHLCFFFLKNGYAVRGGMASGLCQVSPEVIVGEPVVRAVKIEGEIASVPRIAISKATKEILESNRNPSFKKSIKRDTDGIYWIDPFYSAISALLRNHEKWLKAREQDPQLGISYADKFYAIANDINIVIAFLQSNIDNTIENKRVFEKYYWLAQKLELSLEEPRAIVGREIHELNLSL